MRIKTGGWRSWRLWTFQERDRAFP